MSDHTDLSNSLNLLNDSSECREFLRVQYNLNNLYKQELEYVCKSCKDQVQELSTEIDELKNKLADYELSVSEQAQPPSIGPKGSSLNKMLNVSRDEGIFEFHVESFKLTKDVSESLSRWGAIEEICLISRVGISCLASMVP